MIHSSRTNYTPEHLPQHQMMENNHSSRRIGRECSLTLRYDGSDHDLSNLSLKANRPQTEPLYPQRDHVRRLPEIDDSHTLQLWKPLPRSDPPYQRANTVNTCTKNEHSPLQRRTARTRLTRRPSIVPSEGPHAPLALPPLMNMPPPPPPPAPTSLARPSAVNHNSRSQTTTASPPRPAPVSHESRSSSTPSAPLPTLQSPPQPVVSSLPGAGRPMNQPGPRPKVDYKRLYGRDEGPAGKGSRRSLMNSNRHISFQEQQLQRTLQEEERLRQERGDEEVDEEPCPPPPPAPVQQPVIDHRRRQEEPPQLVAPRHQQSTRHLSISQHSQHHHQQHSAPKPPQPQQQPLYTPPPPPPQPPKPQQQQQYQRPVSPPSSGGSAKTVMEIAPNLFVPYKGSHETWEAVQRGQFTVTTCFACCLQLVVIDTAEFLVCPDCHTVSPLSYSDGTNAHVERCGVGLGIKREWCDTEAALPQGTQVQQQQHQSYRPTAAETNRARRENAYAQKTGKKQQEHDQQQHESPEQNPYQRRATFMI